jgi:hypothetical protein
MFCSETAPLEHAALYTGVIELYVKCYNLAVVDSMLAIFWLRRSYCIYLYSIILGTTGVNDNHFFHKPSKAKYLRNPNGVRIP